MKCNPEVFWEPVTEAAWAFQGVWGWTKPCASLGVKWQIQFLLQQSMLVRTGYFMYPPPLPPLSVSQIPFLLIHSVATHSPDYRPPPLQPLNQGHGTWFPENTATGNGKSCLNVTSSSSLTSEQTQTGGGRLTAAFKIDRSCQAGQGGRNPFCFLSYFFCPSHIRTKEKCAATEGRCSYHHYLNHHRLSIKWASSCLPVTFHYVIKTGLSLKKQQLTTPVTKKENSSRFDHNLCI